jgi:hypothetical protein
MKQMEGMEGMERKKNILEPIFLTNVRSESL